MFFPNFLPSFSFLLFLSLLVSPYQSLTLLCICFFLFFWISLQFLFANFNSRFWNLSLHFTTLFILYFLSPCFSLIFFGFVIIMFATLLFFSFFQLVFPKTFFHVITLICIHIFSTCSFSFCLCVCFSLFVLFLFEFCILRLF